MEKGYYEMQWPRDNLYINCFVHEVMNFRYHWHPGDFEMSILLSGKQYFCRGRDSYPLQAGDVILIGPNEGHASYGQEQNTIALVLHFSAGALKGLAAKGKMLHFPSCLSNDDTRNDTKFKIIRGIAAQLILSLAGGGPYAQYTAKACAEMLICVLCNDFDPEYTSGIPEVDEDTQKTMRTIMTYVEEHYAEKISLEEIASISQYNRTYISTLFHKSVGISFYEYLMRVRFQHALRDLVMTKKKMTDVALSNGFADLKSFNNRFREMLDCLPSEYRKKVPVIPSDAEDYHARRYIPCDHPFVLKALTAFTKGNLK